MNLNYYKLSPCIPRRERRCRRRRASPLARSRARARALVRWASRTPTVALLTRLRACSYFPRLHFASRTHAITRDSRFAHYVTTTTGERCNDVVIKLYPPLRCHRAVIALNVACRDVIRHHGGSGRPLSLTVASSDPSLSLSLSLSVSTLAAARSKLAQRRHIGVQRIGPRDVSYFRAEDRASEGIPPRVGHY